MDFKQSNRKAYLERKDEKISELEHEIDVKDNKTPKRIADEKIPSHNLSWLQSNHPELEQPYVDYVKNQSTKLDKASKFLSMSLGIELNKEHPISVSGAGDVELSPTTPISDRGPNDQGFSGNARFNRRLQANNAFNRSDLDQLNVASNWQYSAANFVAYRPDIKDASLRAEMGLKPIGPKVSDLGMLKLQQGDLNVDTLEMKMFIESDLKRSGIELNVDQKASLGAFMLDLDNKEQVVNATKHGDNWNLETKFKHNNPKGSERFEQRVLEGQNAVKRQNPVFTQLPSEAATNPKSMFKELKRVGGKKLFREVVRKMGGSNNVLANISGDVIGTIMDGVTYAQTKDSKALTDLCLSGSQALTSLGALGIACLPIPGARPGAFALMKVGDKIADVERIYNLHGGMGAIDKLLKNGNPLKTTTTPTKVKV